MFGSWSLEQFYPIFPSLKMIVQGNSGLSLNLPFPEDFDEPVILSKILRDFPNILENPEALNFLFEYKNLVVEYNDMKKILFRSSSEVMNRLLQNEKFLFHRSKTIPSIDEIFNFFLKT